MAQKDLKPVGGGFFTSLKNFLSCLANLIIGLDNRLSECGCEPTRYPDYTVYGGLMSGDAKYCIHDGQICEGALPGKTVGCIDKWGRIHKGLTEADEVIANIGEDGRIYEGSFPGKCLGSIVNGVVTLDGNYYPSGPADYTIM